MAIKKGNSRITITISDSTLHCLAGILPLHPNMSKSQVIENAIIAYCNAIVEHYEKSLIKKEIKK